MKIKEAIELIKSYIDPVDNDVIEAIRSVEAEIERKDEAIRTVLKIEPRFGELLRPYFDAMKEILRQALQNKE